MVGVTYSDDVGTIADMLATDLGCRYQQGDRIEGSIMVGEAKETLSILGMDSSLTTKVLTTLVDKGYFDRKGMVFIYQTSPGQNGQAATR